MEVDPDNDLNVYWAWKSAREALSESIRIYISACDALAFVSFGSVLKTSTYGVTLVPDALAIDAELSELVNEEDRLRNARVTLLASRNRSKEFSKVNSLPIEILSSIFLAANPYFEDRGAWHSPTYPATLASVCQLWRQIAFGLPLIWTYLYIRIDGARSANSRKCAELWSHRSQNPPLRLEMRQYNQNGVPKGFSEDLISFMGLIAPRVQDFDIEGSRYVMQLALCNLINNSTPGSLKGLELFEEDESSGFDHFLAWHPDIARFAPSHDRTAEFLSSVQVLKLWSTFFPWHSTAYENLVSLTLHLLADDVGDAVPTQHEMATILASSPMLHTLALTIDFSCRHQQSSVVPIRLNELRSFTLISYEPTCCLGFLPLIAPGLHALDVNITMYSDPTFVEELRSFFARSFVVALHVEQIEAVSWFEPLTKNLPQLESLSLAGCDFTDLELLNFVHASPTSTLRRPPLWPKLEMLELLHCRIDNNVLLDLLAIHSIRTIQIYRGSNTPSHENATVDAKTASMRELVQQLSSVVPEAKYFP
ncbi:hypothetical protein BDV93DRAFT_526085 [Ceratobasidium sp. AG-I]|nr:hypothetical protein BDV93DRAFT_526085 [Ceratobasidium sp. AG-I]